MRPITYYEARDMRAERLKILKKEQGARIYVIFSTFGEREADLIYDKITLLRSSLKDFIDRIFLSHRRDGEGPDRTERRALAASRDTSIILCNHLAVPDMGDEKGKGADMRRALYHINRNERDNSPEDKIILVFLDADVVPRYFGPHFVTGLSGAVLDGHDFAKAGFWRAMGRVKKFMAQPLFSVIDHERLGNLRGFSYPLSGEVGGTIGFFNSVSFWQIYGVETGINIDSSFMDYGIADVNMGLYDHEHHGDLNIQKMAFGIIRTYLKQLVDYGILELKDGARISDRFGASLINEKGERESIDFDLTERKYQPLAGIL